MYAKKVRRPQHEWDCQHPQERQHQPLRGGGIPAGILIAEVGDFKNCVQLCRGTKLAFIFKMEWYVNFAQQQKQKLHTIENPYLQLTGYTRRISGF
jgi:hypothetical protein